LFALTQVETIHRDGESQRICCCRGRDWRAHRHRRAGD